jgi:hypothetical protein
MNQVNNILKSSNKFIKTYTAFYIIDKITYIALTIGVLYVGYILFNELERLIGSR